MTQIHRVLWPETQTVAIVLLCVALPLCGPAAAQDQVAQSAPAPAAGKGAEEPEAAPAVAFCIDRTVVEVGRSRIIPFRVHAVSAEVRQLNPTVSDDGKLDVLQSGEVLDGESLGYCRVRGLKAGEVVLHLGNATLPIGVIPQREGARVDAPLPRILSPSPGAFLWGEVSIGVAMQGDESKPLRTLGMQSCDGSRLSAVEDSLQNEYPLRYARFVLPADKLPAGPCTLMPIAIFEDGSELAGEARRVTIAKPEADAVLAVEAEADFDIERPKRFKDDRRNVGQDEQASGGAFWNNAGAYPAVCVPIKTDTPARYQMMVTARGDWAGGAFPTVEAVVDGAYKGQTNGRLLSSKWHRVSIGMPFSVPAGSHVITPYFANDFYAAGLADRNLFLDRIELARVDDAAGAGASAGGMMMAGGSMMGDDAAPAGQTMMASGTMMQSAEMQDAVSNESQPPSLYARFDDEPDYFGQVRKSVRIAFTEPLDGWAATGRMNVEGRCWWEGSNERPAPLVTLMLNGQAVGVQQSAAPRFSIDTSQLAEGANTLVMMASMPWGAIDTTPMQTVYWTPFDDEPTGASRSFRFSIHEKSWEPDIAGRLTDRHHPAERRAAGLYSQSHITLNLPAEVNGRFDVYVEGRGDRFEGDPEVALSWRAGPDAEAKEIGKREIPNWWNSWLVAEDVSLTGGDGTQLQVAFTNDHHKADVGDRNLFVQAVEFRPHGQQADRHPPRVALRYPFDGQACVEADAVVIEASDDQQLSTAEILLDGKPTGVNLQVADQLGPMVLPLLLRGVSAGRHDVAVEVKDVAGHATRSAKRSIHVLPSDYPSASRYERAVYLLNRFAYGPDLHELAKVLINGEQAWLREQLASPADDPGDLAAMQYGFTRFVNRNNYDTPRRVLDHVRRTTNPARLRFVLWAENHFSTWIRKTQGERKWEEHVSFARLGVAPFEKLLRTSAESPAMLAYLDQESSFANRLNENYAREIMELHTLGVDGGYRQQDVISLARILTGWMATWEGDSIGGDQQSRQYEFRFDHRLSDGEAIRFLGSMIPAASGADKFARPAMALELLASHPSTAAYVCRCLAEHYVAKPAPPQLVEDLRQVFLQTHGDMQQVLLGMAEHPDFWAAMDTPRLASGLDYAARLARVSGHDNPWQVADFLNRSGRGIFDCVTPDGYAEEDTAQIDSNRVIQRWRLADQMQWSLYNQVPHRWRWNKQPDEERWRQQVVDVLAVHITGRLLDEPSDEAALQFLSECEGNRSECIRGVAVLTAQLPEANLR